MFCAELSTREHDGRTAAALPGRLDVPEPLTAPREPIGSKLGCAASAAGEGRSMMARRHSMAVGHPIRTAGHALLRSVPQPDLIVLRRLPGGRPDAR
jgi:hypothetical protein